MTRKDYKMIAACLYNEGVDHPYTDNISTVRGIANRLSVEMKLDNPRFDEARFTEAVRTGKGLGIDKYAEHCGPIW